MYIRIHSNFVVVFSILQNNIVVPQDIHSYGSGILTLRYHSLQVLNGYLLRQHSFSTVPKFTTLKIRLVTLANPVKLKLLSDHLTTSLFIHSFLTWSLDGAVFGLLVLVLQHCVNIVIPIHTIVKPSHQRLVCRSSQM